MGTKLGKYTLVALTLTFGWEPSPGVYSVPATAISSYHHAHLPPDPEDNGDDHCASVTYVDDGVLVAAAIGSLLTITGMVYEEGMVLSLGSDAVSRDKYEAEGDWTTRKICFGIQFDTEAETVTLPEQRVLKLRHFLRQPRWARGSSGATPARCLRVPRGTCISGRTVGVDEVQAGCWTTATCEATGAPPILCTTGGVGRVLRRYGLDARNTRQPGGVARFDVEPIQGGADAGGTDGRRRA
eukprot:30256-Eustigmatos_ZCMA.PRE.1